MKKCEKEKKPAKIKMSNSTDDLNSIEISVILTIKTRIPMILALISLFSLQQQLKIITRSSVRQIDQLSRANTISCLLG